MLRIKEEGELEFPIGTTNIKAIIVVRASLADPLNRDVETAF